MYGYAGEFGEGVKYGSRYNSREEERFEQQDMSSGVIFSFRYSEPLIQVIL